MSDSWTDRLSDYLDGELEAGAVSALEAHLRVCESCHATLAELRTVRERAAALSYRAPGVSLWPGIEEKIVRGRQEPGTAQVVDLVSRLSARHGQATAVPPGAHAFRAGLSRRLTLSLGHLAAAAVFLAVASGGTAWLATRRTVVAVQPPTVTVDRPGRTTDTPSTPPLPTGSLAAMSYDEAVADLERVLAEARGELKPETIAVLEENLRAIDAAVLEARRALQRDPASDYLNRYLAETMQRKLKLLRRAADIAGAQS